MVPENGESAVRIIRARVVYMERSPVAQRQINVGYFLAGSNHAVHPHRESINTSTDPIAYLPTCSVEAITNERPSRVGPPTRRR